MDSARREGPVEDALNRLHRAIDYAVLATVTGSRDQRGKLYTRLAQAFTTQGTVNAAETMAELPNFAALTTVLPLIVTGEGGKSLHPVWDSAGFIAPAVAALAIFFDRALKPTGDSMFTLTVCRAPEALCGYRLERFEAEAVATDRAGHRVAGPMQETDWMRASILLSGAAFAFLKEIDMMHFAPRYLRRAAEGMAEEGLERPTPPERPRPFILVR
jgi:hypothetical protein